MVSQAERIISFIFKRSGKTELSFSDIYLTLSMDLNWFTPEDAKDFIEKAIKEKILKKKEEQIRPLFDISKVEVPIGYKPTGNLFEKKIETKQEEVSILEKIINNISKETKEDKKEIYGKIKKIEEKRNITKEVAALLMVRNNECFSEELYKKIEKEIQK